MDILTKYEKEKKFAELVKDYEKTQYFDGQLCPDQYVGKISEFNEKDDNARMPVFDDKWRVINIPKEEKIMIMILESPHKAEFRRKIGPAKGTTGRNLANMRRLLDFSPYQNHELILMNAIPFQCSLGVTTKKFRDEVFAKAWNDEEQQIKIGASFFKVRLAHLLKKLNRKTVVIVNACTQGCDRKTNVQAAINETASDDIKRFEIAHPCFWAIPELKEVCEC